MGYGMLNLGSIALGLIGWIVPVAGYVLRRWKSGRMPARFAPVLSLGACGLALWFQICYNEHLVNIEDWSALMDTIGAVRLVSIFLLITTLGINILMLALERPDAQREEKP